MKRCDLPDEIVLPCGARLLCVFGGSLAQKPFILSGDCASVDNIVRRARQLKLKYRKVSVLSRNLRGKLDLHHRPYTANVWVFVEVKP